jgi:hypothetical protein
MSFKSVLHQAVFKVLPGFLLWGGEGGVIRTLMKMCNPLAQTLLSCSGVKWSEVEFLSKKYLA